MFQIIIFIVGCMCFMAGPYLFYLSPYAEGESDSLYYICRYGGLFLIFLPFVFYAVRPDLLYPISEKVRQILGFDIGTFN